jgi:hypothetical protein
MRATHAQRLLGHRLRTQGVTTPRNGGPLGSWSPRVPAALAQPIRVLDDDVHRWLVIATPAARRGVAYRSDRSGGLRRNSVAALVRAVGHPEANRERRADTRRAR